MNGRKLIKVSIPNPHIISSIQESYINEKYIDKLIKLLKFN